MREPILQEIYEVINLLKERALHAQSRDMEVMKVRTGYARALAQLVNAYTALKRDVDLDALSKRLDKLEEKQEWVKRT